jgi:ParB-like chromosome segregation protein Spo0J
MPPDDILEFLEYGELSATHGRALLMAKDPEARPKLARAAIEQGWKRGGTGFSARAGTR